VQSKTCRDPVMADFEFIDLTVDDSALLPVSEEPRIGVDTEFMRERTYYAELSLLQISTGTQIFCADPLGSASNSPRPSEAFWRSITRPEWVIHSGRQDIEVIFHTAAMMPRAVFDTQVAAALLGYQPQIGYAGLVSELFGTELDKAHTRANWSRRPLADELLHYAAEDVKYLLPAYDELTGRLAQQERLEWAIQDSRDLLDESLYETDPSLAIHRLKGARSLRGRARAAAEALAAWRESEAVRRNRPRQWILRDSVLIELAVNAPASMSALRRLDGLAEKTIDRVGRELLQILADATHDKTGYRPPPRPDEKQKAALKEMQRIVAACADSLGLAAELIAPKKELSAAMLGQRDSRVFRGWRRDLIGDELLGILDVL
jgi:ribonuclease D